MSDNKQNMTAYWKANVRLILGCMIVWALCSHVIAIFLRPALMGIKIFNIDIGFWFGQQGSMLTFIAIIFFFSWRMNKIDEAFGVHEE